MDYKYIEQLLERYWQCETSLEEEAILRTFFAQKDVPAHLRRYQTLFSGIKSIQEAKLGKDFDQKILAQIHEGEQVKARRITFSHRLMPLYKAAASVAIVLTLGNAIQTTVVQKDPDHGYKYENYQDSYKDPSVAYDQVSNALQMVSQGLSEASEKDSLAQSTRN